MPLPDDIRRAFPAGEFSPPATPAAIATVETELGVQLPLHLRAVYLAFDGFREPIGNAAYISPLLDPGGGVLTMTQLIWDYGADGTFPDLRDCVFFGSSAGDESWGMRVRPPYEIVAYHHDMEDQYESLGSSLLDVFLADQRKYDDVAG